MANKIYNTKVVESTKASTGNDKITGGIAYRGFNSRAIKQKFKSYDLNLIKQDILNHFYIKQGEKLENPLFGTVIWSMIYEPMDDNNIRIVEDDVIRILRSDPRVAVNSVAVIPTEQGIRIEVDLKYLEFNLADQLLINFDKSNLPT